MYDYWLVRKGGPYGHLKNVSLFLINTIVCIAVEQNDVLYEMIYLYINLDPNKICQEVRYVVPNRCNID